MQPWMEIGAVNGNNGALLELATWGSGKRSEPALTNTHLQRSSAPPRVLVLGSLRRVGRNSHRDPRCSYIWNQFRGIFGIELIGPVTPQFGGHCATATRHRPQRMVDVDPVAAVHRRDRHVRVHVPARKCGTQPIWPRADVLGSIPRIRHSVYEALATPRPSRSTLRFNAMTRPSTPSRRRIALNSERCTASWLIVPSR
jgi:hypothetical protein